jgi:hypothetical protein
VGFKLDNIGNVVIAGEVPPQRMRKLLEGKWGMGSRLTSLCLAAYGGHLHYTAMAISELSTRKEDFSAVMVVPKDRFAGISQCIAAEATHPGIIDLLRNLAVFGFAEIKLEGSEDPRAQMLVKLNVAGYVEQDSFVVGLPSEVWEKARFGLVPSSQQVRLMIGEMLSSPGTIAPTKGIKHSAPWLLDTFPL